MIVISIWAQLHLCVEMTPETHIYIWILKYGLYSNDTEEICWVFWEYLHTSCSYFCRNIAYYRYAMGEISMNFTSLYEAN